jgi:hypothetical protein
MAWHDKFYFAPASKSKEIPYHHLERTVLSVPPASAYEGLDVSGVSDPRFWGLKSTQRNYWNDLTGGEWVLFYTGNRKFTVAAQIADTAHSRSVAEQLWPDYHTQIRPEDDKRRWEYLLVLENVNRVDIPSVEFLDTMGYDMEYPMGFMSPADENRRQFYREYDSVAELVEEHHVERLT